MTKSLVYPSPLCICLSLMKNLNQPPTINHHHPPKITQIVLTLHSPHGMASHLILEQDDAASLNMEDRLPHHFLSCCLSHLLSFSFGAAWMSFQAHHVFPFSVTLILSTFLYLFWRFSNFIGSYLGEDDCHFLLFTLNPLLV